MADLSVRLRPPRLVTMRAMPIEAVESGANLCYAIDMFGALLAAAAVTTPKPIVIDGALCHPTAHRVDPARE